MNALEELHISMWEVRMANYELYDPSQYDKNEISKITQMENLQHYHLIAMRCYKGLDRIQMSEVCNVPFEVLEYYETLRDTPIPKPMEEIYLLSLGITKLDFKKIKQILEGKRTMDEESDRDIPLCIRDEVRKRDNNRCSECAVKKHLNFHHIKKYSEGGMHTVENLKLLCVSCHAETHKGERGYGLLKSRVEKIIGGEDNGRTQTKEVCI